MEQVGFATLDRRGKRWIPLKQKRHFTFQASGESPSCTTTQSIAVAADMMEHAIGKREKQRDLPPVL
jgi:hypothetical protein